MRKLVVSTKPDQPGSSKEGTKEAQTVGNRVEVNGMQMYYEVSGEGDPLVVLHGAYMNILTMGEIIPKLAKTHKVYALEFQGHGRTTDIDRPITYPNLADDVAAFMDAVGLAKADVFGYSMGDQGKPLAASRLAILPATAHTAVITQPDLLHSFIEPFLKGETPKGMFENAEY